jgi:hypothetical protein
MPVIFIFGFAVCTASYYKYKRAGEMDGGMGQQRVLVLKCAVATYGNLAMVKWCEKMRIGK